MKRWTFRILIFLILVSGGVVTTVGVAWGLAVFTDAWRSSARELVPTGHLQTIDVSASGPGYVWTRSAIGAREALDVGFPLSALRMTASPVETDLFKTSDTTFLRHTRTLILPGFIINTLFYATIWFGVFFGFGAARRGYRRRRGRCVRCGYDLRGNVTNGQDARSTSQDARSIGTDARSTGCPECGWSRPST